MNTPNYEVHLSPVRNGFLVSIERIRTIGSMPGIEDIEGFTSMIQQAANTMTGDSWKNVPDAIERQVKKEASPEGRYVCQTWPEVQNLLNGLYAKKE